MLTPEILLAAGYMHFHDGLAATKLESWYRGSYQKRFRDDLGTRYFITILHGTMPSIGGNPSRDFFAPSNQFTKDGTTFNVEMLHHAESLEQIEDFFQKLWSTMQLDYYEGGPQVEPEAASVELG